MRLMVVDDPRLGEMAQREWSARSDTPLELNNIAEAEFAAAVQAGKLSERADAIIFPPRYLGGLAESKMITKVPKRSLDSESLAYSDIFNLPRRREATWGETTFAIPLGSPTFVLAYRGDLVAEEPPKDWEEVDGWLSKFKDKADSDSIWLGQPMAGNFPAQVLLARAASRIRMPGQISTLFDFRTLEPLIDQPPFVRSLDELVDCAKTSPAESQQWTMQQLQRAFESGSCVAAILWMVPPDPNVETPELAEGVQIRFAQLPGSKQVYSYSENAWTERRNGRATSVPLIGIDGRMAAVVKSSRRQKSAWNLLNQLAGTEMLINLSSASQATAPVRHLQVDQSQRWTGLHIEAAAAREYGATIKQALSGTTELTSPNFPGQREYMSALSVAIRKVIAGEATSQKALDQVKIEWTVLNEKRGAEKQLKAYARSLGIEP